MSDKQTAVEWLEKELKDRYSLMNSDPLFEQAKAIEEEQQRDKYLQGYSEGLEIGSIHSPD